VLMLFMIFDGNFNGLLICGVVFVTGMRTGINRPLNPRGLCIAVYVYKRIRDE